MPEIVKKIGGPVVAAILAAGLLWGVIYLAVLRPVSLQQSTASARAGEIVSQAQTNAATGAVKITAETAAKNAATDATTERSSRAITTSPGASAPIDPALHRAGLTALCMRDDVNDPRCADLLHGDGQGVGAGVPSTSRPAAGGQ